MHRLGLEWGNYKWRAGRLYDNIKGMRILLGEEDFDRLTSGEVIEQDGVKIALSDIGYDRMLQIIEPKLQGLLKDK